VHGNEYKVRGTEKIITKSTNNQINKIKQHIALIILLFIGLSSCIKEVNPHWKADILAPLLKTTINISDIINDSNLVANPDNSISLVIEQKLDMKLADSAVTMGDTISAEAFGVPLILTIKPGQKVIKKYSETQLKFGEMQLTKTKASRAKIKFEVRSGVKQPLLISYKLFSATKDGVVYETMQEVPGATEDEFAKLTTSIEFDDYILDLTGEHHDTYNTIYALTTVWIHPDADTVVVFPEDSISIVSTFDEFIPEYVSGYLGQIEVLTVETTALNSFSSIKSGTMNLKEANAKIDIYNYVGADVSLVVNEISSMKNQPYEKIILNHSIVGSSINMRRAVESNNPSYPVYPKHQIFDISGTNLDNMIEILPDSFLFSIDAILNPLGNISSGNDFLYFDRTIEASLKLEIPLNLSTNNLVFEEYSELKIPEGVKGGTLQVYLDNMFPFRFNTQLLVLDSKDNIIDSLILGDNLISNGIPVSGIVQSPYSSIINISLNDKIISELLNNEKILIRLKVNSASNMMYKIYDHYSLKVKIVGDFEYEY